MAEWHFQPGESGNKNGRPIGSRNKRTTEIVNQIISSGNKDPLLTLSDLQAQSADEGIRATAANMLAPYLHSKRMAIPAPRYIERPFELPNNNPTTEGEINTNLGALNQAYASGDLDYDSYTVMLAGQHQHINALKAREEIPANMDIQITGGLPELPGTNITMPLLNGHQIEMKEIGHAEVQHADDQSQAVPPGSDVG
jgi:hypothetical protein